MDDETTNRRRRRTAAIAQAYRESHEIMSICLSLGLLTGVGYWCDVKTDMKPVFTLGGVGLGIVSAGFQLKHLLARLERQRDRRKKSSSESKGPGGL